MSKILPLIALMLAPAAWAQERVCPPTGDTICTLSSLDLTPFTNGYGALRKDRSIDGNPLTIRDTVYCSGVGAHAESRGVIKVNGATRFQAVLGIDDEVRKAGEGVVAYEIRLHRNRDKAGTVVKSGVISRTDPAGVKVDVALSGYDYITLYFGTNGVNWSDHANWANAYFTYTGEKPVAVSRASMYVSATIAPPTSDATRDIALLGDMDLTKISNGWGRLQKNKSIDGNPLILNDTIYSSGVGCHSPSKIIVKLNGATRFVGRVAMDDEVATAAQQSPTNYAIGHYRVSLRSEDGTVVEQAAGDIKYGKPSPTLDINTNGWKYLILETTNGAGGNAGDHVDWLNAYLEYYARAATPPYLVSEEEIASKLACATTVFSQPGVRFMHKLKASNPSATFAVSDLPEGLTYNAARKLVEGVVAREGVYTYRVSVTNDGQTATEPVKLTVLADLPQPVPFMGWLSWNVFEHTISDDKVRAVADAFERYGLIDAGYRYLCLDDQWHAASRKADGTPQYDTTKFPNGFKPLADYVHAKGLKFGIYSDAGTATCAGMFGSVGYETIDAKTYADWGFDLLKYDYCNAPGDRQTAEARYKAMGDALSATGRNILYYICEWGVREPWKWGSEVGGTTWRVTYDSRDTWQHGRYDGGHCGVIEGLDIAKRLWPYGGVNRFNDADMMCVGLHGKGKSSSHDGARGMTQTEYQSQFSLWSIMASPLTLSFDVRQISDADLAIITNAEVIAINQDRMGQQGELVQSDETYDVLVKDLENGDVAVAVLNRSGATKRYTLDFAKAYLSADSTYIVRDLWRKANLDTTQTSYTFDVASHETRLFRLSLANQVTSVASAVANAQQPLRVSIDKQTLVVSLPESEGQAKRILVSDLNGRVWAQTTSKAAVTTLPLYAPKGHYVVNVVAGAQARSTTIAY